MGELESNIEGLWVGYQDHRHTFPTFVPRIHFINTFVFLTAKEQTIPPELFKCEISLPG